MNSAYNFITVNNPNIPILSPRDSLVNSVRAIPQCSLR